jgi:hypothetical protein
MRCYTKQPQFYCGIDLHARTMSACIWNHHLYLESPWRDHAPPPTLGA